MSTYLDNYRKRVGLGTTDRRDKLVLQSERTFEKMLIESPSGKRLKATIPGQVDILGNVNEIDCIIQNISNNDIKAFDQKFIEVRKNENFDIGCYVEFDGAYWIAIYREHKTLETNKKFTLAKCNNIWKYKVRGTVYEFPIYVQNLSLYSDGLADNKYTSQEDGKTSIYYGENEITKKADVNTRIIIGNRSMFRMTNINDYEYRSNHNTQCVIKAMLLQTTVTDKDDVVNNIAWNPEGDVDSVDNTVAKIVGDSSPMIGSRKTYDCAKNSPFRHWEVECSSELRKSLVFETPGGGDKHCEFKFPGDVRFVGEVIKLKLFVSNTLRDTLEITLRGL